LIDNSNFKNLLTGATTENGTIARSGILSGFFKSTVQKSLNQWVAYLKACLDK